MKECRANLYTIGLYSYGVTIPGYLAENQANYHYSIRARDESLASTGRFQPATFILGETKGKSNPYFLLDRQV